MATISTTFKAINQMSPAFQKMASSLGGVISSIGKVERALKGVDEGNIDSIADSAKEVDSALEELETEAREVDAALDSIDSGGLNSVAKSAKDADAALDGLDDGAKEVSNSIDRVENASNKLKTIGSTFQGVGSAMSSIGKVGSVVTGALTGIAGSAVKTTVDFTKLYESSQIVFERMLGGKDAAKAMYSSLLDIAKASTISQETFLEAGKSLVGVGVSAQNTTKYLQAITDAVTGAGGGAEQVEQLTEAFRKVSTNGRLSMEEVNSMADANVNVLKILGNQYGVTTDEMRDMISDGTVPAEEALAKLSDGIEKGTDGINGMTQAMEGMAASMKGSTLTGALDSLKSTLRSFKLSITGIDLTGEILTDPAEIAESEKRYNQLTAAITKFNEIISASKRILIPMREAFGQLLDKLIGTEPVFNKATGQWEQTGGVLTQVLNIINSASDDQLRSVGNALLGVGGTAPVLLGTGKAISAIGAAIDSLSEKKEILNKVFNAFSSRPKEEETAKETHATQTPKKSKNSVSLPNLSTPFKAYIQKIKDFGSEITSTTNETATQSTSAMKQSFGSGINSFIDSIKASFEQGKERANVGGFFEKLRTNFSNGMNSFGSSAKVATDKNGLIISTALGAGLEGASKNGTIKNAFSTLSNTTNTESLSFGQKLKASFTNALPKGDTLFSKFINSFTTFGTTLTGVATAAGGAFKAIIPANIASFFSTKLSSITSLFTSFTGSVSGALGPIGTFITSALTPLSGLFGTLSGVVSSAFSAITTALGPVMPILGSVVSGLVSLSTSFLSFAGIAGIAITAIGGVVGALGLLNKEGQASKAIDSFFSGFNEKISSFGKMATDAIQSFVQNLIANFPQLVQRGSEMVVSLITGIGTTIPNLIGTGATIVINLLTGLIQSLPSLISGGFQAIQAIATGIMQNAPTIWASVQNALGMIGQAITTNLPIIIESGKQILNSLITGFSQLIPFLWNWGVSAITGLWNTIVTGLPGFISAGCELITNLISGIIQAIPNLLLAGAQMIGSLIGAIWEHRGEILQTGANLIWSLITGLLSLTGTVISAVFQIGSAIVQGIWNGISGLWASFTGWLGGIFQGVIDTVKGIFGVASPSTIFADIGGNLINGLWQGVQNVWNSVSGFFADIGQKVIDFFKPSEEVDYTEMISATEAQINDLKDKIGALYEEIKNQTLSNNQAMAQGTIAIFQSMTSGVIAQISNLAAQSAVILSALPAQFTAAFSQLFTLTAGYLDQMKNQTLAKVTEMMTNMTGPLGQLTGVFINIFSQINALTLQFLAGFEALAVSAITGLAGALGGALSSLAMSFVGAFNGMVTGCIAVLNLLYISAMSIMTMISTGTLSIIAAMQAGIVGYFTGISVAVTGLAAAMSASIIASVTAMSTGIIMATTAMSAAFTAFVAGMSLTLTTLSVAFATTFASLVTTSIAALNVLAAGALSIMTTISTGVLAIVAAMTAGIVTYFAGLSVSVTGLITAMSASIVGAITLMNASIVAATATLYTTFVVGWATMTAQATALITGFTLSVITQFNLLNVSVMSIMANFRNTITQAIIDTSTNAIAQVSFMVSSILATIGVLPSEFRRIAEEMMNELIAGINARAAAVVNATDQLVQKLKSTFITGLGIHSPSRFMTYVGEMMAAGLMEGLSQSQIKKFTEAVMEDMKNSFKEGNFDPNQLVDYLGKDTEKVIQYLIDTGDNTIGKLMPGTSAVPPIVAAAERYVGYRETGGTSIFGARYGNPGGEWCAYFVHAMADDVGVPFPDTGYVPTVMSWAQSNGRWTHTPQAGYAAIFRGGGHIEIVASVDGAGNVTTIGGNTGSPRGVYKHVRNGATGYVALDGGGGNGMGMMTLKDTIQFAYLKKVMEGSVPGVDFTTLTKFFGGYSGNVNLSTAGSGLLNPGWFQAWTPPPAVARWAPQVLTVLAMLGQPASLLKGVLWAINGESGGDPNSTYLGDINVIYGGSKGLLQTITPNYNRWKNPALPQNIYDPLQNIWCCLREMQSTYGGIAQLINRKIARGHWSGYARGTDYATPGLHWVGEKGPELLCFGGGECVIPNDKSLNLASYLSLPGFAVGTRKVPEDMLSVIHEGEAILPKTQNPYSQSGGNYLQEIGKTIGTQVLDTAIGLESLDLKTSDFSENYRNSLAETQSLQNEEGLNYKALSSSIAGNQTVTTTTTNNANSNPINLEVNIGTVNNQGDLDRIEDRVVQVVTNAISRANKATGGVASV